MYKKNHQKPFNYHEKPRPKEKYKKKQYRKKKYKLKGYTVQ